MRDYVQDQWAPLAHTPDLNENRRPSSAIAPTWIDDIDARRLTAYRVLSAMRDNTRRHWRPESMWARKVRGRGQGLDISEAPAASYREYGDAALLVDTARALLTVPRSAGGRPAASARFIAAAAVATCSGVRRGC